MTAHSGTSNHDLFSSAGLDEHEVLRRLGAVDEDIRPIESLA